MTGRVSAHQRDQPVFVGVGAVEGVRRVDGHEFVALEDVVAVAVVQVEERHESDLSLECAVHEFVEFGTGHRFVAVEVSVAERAVLADVRRSGGQQGVFARAVRGRPVAVGGGPPAPRGGPLSQPLGSGRYPQAGETCRSATSPVSSASRISSRLRAGE